MINIMLYNHDYFIRFNNVNIKSVVNLKWVGCPFWLFLLKKAIGNIMRAVTIFSCVALAQAQTKTPARLEKYNGKKTTPVEFEVCFETFGCALLLPHEMFF